MARVGAVRLVPRRLGLNPATVTRLRVCSDRAEKRELQVDGRRRGGHDSGRGCRIHSC